MPIAMFVYNKHVQHVVGKQYTNASASNTKQIVSIYKLWNYYLTEP